MKGKLALVVLMAMLLATATWAGGQTEGPMEIEMWKGPHTDHDTDAFKDVIADFEKAHPGVKVKYVPTPWETIAEKYSTALAAGKGPTLFWSATGGLWDAAVKMAYSYPDIFTKAEMDKLGEGSGKSLIEGNRSEGRLIGFPWTAGGDKFYYNEKMIKDAGFNKPPDNVNELLQQSRALTQDLNGDGKPDQWGWGMIDFTEAEAKAENFLYPAGFKGIADDGKSIGYDDPRARAAWEFVDKLYNVDAVALPAGVYLGPTETMKALIDGKFAFMVFSHAETFLPNFPDPSWDKGVLRVSTIPQGPGTWLNNGRAVYTGSSIWCIPTAVKGKKLDLAKDMVLNYLHNPDYLAKIAAFWNFVPGSAKVAAKMNLSVFQKQMLETIATGIPYIYNDHQGPISEILRDTMWSVALGKSSAKAAFEDAVKRGKAEMAK